MNFEVLDWDNYGRGKLAYRPNEYIVAPRPYALLADRRTDHYDVLQNKLIVYRNPVWERKVDDECHAYGSDSESSYKGIIESIARVHDFVCQPEKRQRIDEGDLFQEGLQVGLKKSLFEDIFVAIKGEVWLRVVERGPFDKDPHHYSHALRQVVPAHVLATEHPCKVKSWEWYPHYLRPQDVLSRAVFVVDYSR